MASVTSYNFLSLENKMKWEKELFSGLRKIQKQVHPRLNIEDEAIEYLESLVYQLLSQICSCKPHSVTDVEEHVQATFAYPIDEWSLNEAHEKLNKHALRKRNVSHFPVDRIHHQLMKDVLRYKLDVIVVQFTMNVLDYVAADILKLAGIFVKNTHAPSMTISRRDVEVSLSADTSLQALFKLFQTPTTTDLNIDVEINTDLSSMKYDELLRELVDNETQFIRQLNLLLKVFYPPFLSNPDIFPEEQVDMIFGPVQYVHELSVTLLGSVEEMIEVASEMSTQGSTYPQIGFCFEDITESGEMGGFIDYTDRYSEAVVELELLMDDPKIIAHFKKETFEGKLPKLYTEAVKYVLPKTLLEPIYHFFYYYAIMTAMVQVTDDDDDRTAFESAISATLADKVLVEKISQRFLSKKKEEAGLFGRRAGFKFSVKKLNDIQSKVEGWEGPDIHTHCTELIKEGLLMVAREGKKSSKQKVERYVFLLDGLVICCKTRKTGNHTEYRMKEKLAIKRNMIIKDLDDSDDAKFSFELNTIDHPSLLFSAKTHPEKNEWMAAFTALLTRSTFERQLNLQLREDEKNIPELVPDPKEYLFAEIDSDDNIIFEEEQRDNHLLIKAATIHKLIERLTYHEYADPTFVRTFLMTYRSFCKPGELLNMLIERYHIPLPVDTDDLEARRDPLQREAMKRFKANYVSPVQLRVLNVLRHWVENHYYDFEQDHAALNHLKDFVGTVKAKNVQKWVSSIHRALAKREGKSDQSITSAPVFFQPPPPIEWHIAKNKEDFHILTLHPLEFARQLTLILSELFRAIQSSELVDASWTKDSKKEMASPNLLKMSRFETKLTNWIRHTIVFTENFDERVALCSRLIDIMMELKEMNNFAALFAINAAFQCSQVFRLKSTLKELSKKKQSLDDLQQLCASGKGYKNYKERLRAINPPCVPFLGMYLTWIVFIRDGNDGRVKGKPEHFINFKKRRMIANILQEIQQYQNSRYCLKGEPLIQEYLKSHDLQGDISHNQWEDQLYDQSLEIESRDQPPKKTPREHKFDLRPPSAHPGAFAHILDATIRRQPKKLETQDDLTSSLPNNGSIESAEQQHHQQQHHNKQEDNPPIIDDLPLPPKPPPKLPPKPHPQMAGGTNSPPPIMPRSTSPKYDTDPHLTYRKPPPRPPPVTSEPRPPPINIEQVPPRIPRRDQSSPLSPLAKEVVNNKLQEENIPPVPPRPQSPLVTNDNSFAPPLPPPPVNPSDGPPPLIPRVSNVQNVTAVDNKDIDEMGPPPTIPPKASSSVPSSSKGPVPPPTVPRQRVTSEPTTTPTYAPPIPPKPVR